MLTLAERARRRSKNACSPSLQGGKYIALRSRNPDGLGTAAGSDPEARPVSLSYFIPAVGTANMVDCT